MEKYSDRFLIRSNQLTIATGDVEKTNQLVHGVQLKNTNNGNTISDGVFIPVSNSSLRHYILWGEFVLDTIANGNTVLFRQRYSRQLIDESSKILTSHKSKNINWINKVRANLWMARAIDLLATDNYEKTGKRGIHVCETSDFVLENSGTTFISAVLGNHYKIEIFNSDVAAILEMVYGLTVTDTVSKNKFYTDYSTIVDYLSSPDSIQNSVVRGIFGDSPTSYEKNIVKSAFTHYGKNGLRSFNRANIPLSEQHIEKLSKHLFLELYYVQCCSLGAVAYNELINNNIITKKDYKLCEAIDWLCNTLRYSSLNDEIETLFPDSPNNFTYSFNDGIYSKIPPDSYNVSVFNSQHKFIRLENTYISGFHKNEIDPDVIAHRKFIENEELEARNSTGRNIPVRSIDVEKTIIADYNHHCDNGVDRAVVAEWLWEIEPVEKMPQCVIGASDSIDKNLGGYAF
jgi:hypothetical protein